jgi:hypothetical protein
MLYGSANFSDEALEAFYNMFAEEFGETYDKSKMACNKPRPTRSGDEKSHVVKWCHDGKEELKKFGQKGAETAGKPKEGESERMKMKRKKFKSRHAENIAKGPSSSAWWSDKFKWSEAMDIMARKNIDFN